MTRPTTDQPTIVDDFEVVRRGDLPADVDDYVRSRIIPLGDQIGEPVYHTRIRLTHEPNPAFDRPVIAQGNLHLKGRMVRAQVAGHTAYEAIDRLRERLQARLPRFAVDWEARRGSMPSDDPHEWRRTEEPAEPLPYYPRPSEEREVVRHKSFTPHRIPPDEAVREMEQFDYDFHLFTDKLTALDAVVYRMGSEYLLQLTSERPEIAIDIAPIRLNAKPAPRLSLDEARDRLELAGLPFVFFVDPDTDRGAVLYHRYDGHYGLITPS